MFWHLTHVHLINKDTKGSASTPDIISDYIQYNMFNMEMDPGFSTSASKRPRIYRDWPHMCGSWPAATRSTEWGFLYSSSIWTRNKHTDEQQIKTFYPGLFVSQLLSRVQTLIQLELNFRTGII